MYDASKHPGEKMRGRNKEGEGEKGRGEMERFLERKGSQTDKKRERKRKKEIFPISGLVEIGRSQPAG